MTLNYTVKVQKWCKGLRPTLTRCVLPVSVNRPECIPVEKKCIPVGKSRPGLHSGENFRKSGYRRKILWKTGGKPASDRFRGKIQEIQIPEENFGRNIPNFQVFMFRMHKFMKFSKLVIWVYIFSGKTWKWLKSHKILLKQNSFIFSEI